VIGLQPGEAQVLRVADLSRQGQRRRARLDAAAVTAHVDLDVHRQFDAGLGGGFIDAEDLSPIVNADSDICTACQCHQAAQFLTADDLIGDEDVAHPAVDHRLGLADLLDADADGAEFDLL
jgi:hypothetical protein